MAKKHIRRYYTSLVIMEIQIPTTMIYPLTHTRKAIVKKTLKISIGKDGEKLHT